jgi:endonuclease/exonuclease/phosphatase family metal-dependent hydrolase
VTKPILEGFTSQPWIQQQYLLSDVDGRTFADDRGSYGVLMLIHKSLGLKQLLLFPFPSRQGRQLLLAEIQQRNEVLLVGTVHLESSKNNSRFRSDQLKVCDSVFEKYTRNRPNVTSLLMGDFNFDAKWPENAKQMNILKNWADLWLALYGPNNPGNTFQNVIRFDRIMFQSFHVHPVQMRIIGTQSIGQSPKKDLAYKNFYNYFLPDKKRQQMTNIYISDHCGLMADFDLSYV